MSRLSPYWLWVLLALPSIGILNDAFTSTDPKVFKQLLHPTGEFAARFMIIAMLATPLGMVFKGWRGPHWLKKNRRYFGVAAFGYAILHLIFYLIHEGTIAKIIGELDEFRIWTGWVAFLIFVPLAATSMDYMVRKMGPKWKSLQRWTYVAAGLTLFHWLAMDDWKEPGPAIVHFTPLILLSAYRVWYWYLRPSRRAKPA